MAKDPKSESVRVSTAGVVRAVNQEALETYTKELSTIQSIAVEHADWPEDILSRIETNPLAKLAVLNFTRLVRSAHLTAKHAANAHNLLACRVGKLGASTSAPNQLDPATKRDLLDLVSTVLGAYQSSLVKGLETLRDVMISAKDYEVISKAAGVNFEDITTKFKPEITHIEDVWERMNESLHNTLSIVDTILGEPLTVAVPKGAFPHLELKVYSENVIPFPGPKSNKTR